MNRLFILLPLFFSLAGCETGERLPPWNSIQIFHNRYCFSVDKKDVLNRYKISSVQAGVDKVFAAKEHVALSYPDSCLYLSPLPTGYIYKVSFTLNNQEYRDAFLIEGDGNIRDAERYVE